MNYQKQKFKIREEGISFALLTLAFICLCCFMNAKIDCYINSDMSCDLILGKLLSSENKLVSKNWYYTTELRVFNIQILFSFFFHLTNNWHIVRICSNICMYIILLLAYFFLCKSLNCKKHFAITAILLLIPFSYTYFDLILLGILYIPFIAIIFFSLGLSELYIDTESFNRNFFLGISAGLAFLSGLGGIRQLVILYIPLALECSALLFDKEFKQRQSTKKNFIFSLISLCAGGLGYVINANFLSKRYHFLKWDNISFSTFDISKAVAIFNGFLNTYGFSNGNIFSTALIDNFLCASWIILTVISIIYAFKKKKDVSEKYFRLAFFTLASFVIYVLIYCLTDMQYTDRYNIPVIVCSIPLLAIALEEINFQTVSIKLCIWGFIIISAINGSIFWAEQSKLDNTFELRKVSNELLSLGYDSGYATFWNGNALTELSNGNIEVWNYSTDITQMLEWGQLVKHSTTHPQGKVFVLFTNDEYLNNQWGLGEDNIIYKSDVYTILGYKNYSDLTKEFF